MSKAAYIGVGNVARKVKKMYVGVNGVARQVKKGYVGVNGVARQFFASSYFEYSGTYTESDMTIDGKAYKLYTLTSSGTLNCSEGRFWMCGGGAGGQKGYTYLSNRYVTAGGGGGGGYIVSGYVEGVHSVIIGAGGASDSNGGSTSCDEKNALGGYCATGSNTQSAAGGNGGSGGGAPVYAAVANSGWGNNNGGKGAGVSTYPFGVEALFRHCAGGSAGITRLQYTSGAGFAGGTNGGDGGGTSTSDISFADTPAAGGEKGGGTGGRIPGYREAETVINGGDATFFGSGAGGAGAYFYAEGSTSNKFGTGGIGYQGVMYVLQETA